MASVLVAVQSLDSASMDSSKPSIVMIGGPNGAGKSTAAPYLLREALAVSEFVNADVIARGLSGFDPGGSAMSAGRVMLARLHELASRRRDFAFETTMASRSFAPWLRGLIDEGYLLHLVFLWISSPETAIARVRARVQAGGHDVLEATVRRRYARGLQNFLSLYRPLATTWRVYDNSSTEGPRFVARGGVDTADEILDDGKWERIQAR